MDTNFKTTMKGRESLIDINSPKSIQSINSKYDNVESRIKFLLDRDKKNKKISKELKEQNIKIDHLEQRQEKLLMRQYQQNK